MEVPRYADIVTWPDSTLIAWREQATAELERDPRNEPLRRVYDASTQEMANRTRNAWRRAS